MSRKYEKLSISNICDFLDYTSVNAIDDYFNARTEPSTDFLRKYSDFFGLEYKWLRHGEGNKFIKKNYNPTLPKDYNEHIDFIKPDQIFFIRSKDENGEAGIILRLTDYKFIILPRTYNISDKVGGTGQSQIDSFYDLIKDLSRTYPSHKLSGLQLDRKEFDELFNGEVYPGKYFNGYRQASYWWDDFLDYNHKYPIAKDYEFLYGKGFIEAQRIVRYYKEKSCA
jgi:transcriptional regulator with XRE-family HTH domain